MTWAAMKFRILRPLAILVLPMLLFACAPKLQPLGPVVTTPAFGADRLVMDDGVALPLRHWPAEGKTKADLIRTALRQAAGSALRAKPRARGVFDGPADLAERADEHLAESGFGEP